MTLKISKTIFVNLITLSRILILVPMVFLGSKNQIIYTAIWVAFSDFIDGFLARKWGVVTSFGTKLDQNIDKLVSLIFILFFMQLQQLSLFFVILVLLREFLIVIFRYYNWSNIQSNFIGKAKTFFLYILFVFLSSQHLFTSFILDIKTLFMVLVIVSSWLSFILTITKINSQAIYFIGTTALSALFIKKASGTISSFFAFVLFFILLKSLGIEYKIGLLIMLLIFHFSYYDAFILNTKSPNDDPSIYTLDETIAIIVAWVFLGELYIINLIFLFSLFRFFDIYKFLGIRAIEKNLRWSKAFRNLADDLLSIFYVILIFILFQQYAT
jgi:phosphatidylglycerophosphate synthase